MGDGVRHRTPVTKAAGSSVDHARWVAYRGAEVCGVRMRGLPAWLTHRTCHLLKLPTLNRRLRVVSDRTLALLFRREVVSLDVLEPPRADFLTALRAGSSGPSPAGPNPRSSAEGSWALC